MSKIERTFLEKTKLFFSPLSQDRNIYGVGLLIVLVWGIDSIIYVFFLERISFSLENNNVQSFYNTLWFIVFYIFFYVTFNVIFHKRGWTEIHTTVIKYLQNIYLKKYVAIDNNHTEKIGTGKTIAILDKGFDKWGKGIHNCLEQGTYILVSFLFTSYMVAKNSSFLFGLFIFIYLCIFFISYILNVRAIEYRKKRRDWTNTHVKNLVKIIMSKNEILHSEKIKYEIKNLDYCLNKEIYYNKKMSPYLTTMFELPNVLIAILILGILYIFGEKYLAGTISLSSIFGISAAFLIMLGAINKGVDFFKNFTKEFTDVEKLWEFFDEAPQIQGYDTGEDFSIKKGSINLKNVTYGYSENQNIFEDFDLNIEGGKVTALVGPSGGGKSTLVKLIAGYIHADTGDIIIDSQKIREVSLKSYYKNIGYLTQEPSVFDGTIRENLGYALETQVSDDKMKEVLEIAECQFVFDLEKGIDTEIGERGVRLSGGQKQRLAIAKIFLKNPKIIILDEPTSALDSISEKQISLAMQKLFENRTVIVIAHRLQTVKHADEIIYIQNGFIIERGNHKELVKQKGLYNEMLELQSGF